MHRRQQHMICRFVPAAALGLAAGLVLCAAGALAEPVPAACQERADRAYALTLQYHQGVRFPDLIEQARNMHERLLISRLFGEYRFQSGTGARRGAELAARRVIWRCQRDISEAASER
jgi:hypothetical protein